MIETSTSLADLLTLLFCEGVFRIAGIVAVAWRRAGHVGSGGGPLFFFKVSLRPWRSGALSP